MVFGTQITLSGSPVLVDGFTYKSENCVHYILSHFHSDHTGGLGKTFRHGLVYCTNCTRDLLVEVTGVREEFVVGLELGKKTFSGGWGGSAELAGSHCAEVGG